MTVLPSMMIKLSAIALVALLSLSGCADPEVDNDTLSFSLPDLDGNLVSLTDERFRDKVVLVELWGVWCKPCINQIPHLRSWQDKFRDTGLEIVAIEFGTTVPESPEDYRAELRKFAEANVINYTILVGGTTFDVSTALPTFQNPEGFPTSIFVGRDGKVRHIKSGFHESEVSFYRGKIVELLAEAASPDSAIPPAID